MITQHLSRQVLVYKQGCSIVRLQQLEEYCRNGCILSVHFLTQTFLWMFAKSVVYYQLLNTLLNAFPLESMLQLTPVLHHVHRAKFEPQNSSFRIKLIGHYVCQPQFFWLEHYAILAEISIVVRIPLTMLYSLSGYDRRNVTLQNKNQFITNYFLDQITKQK